MIALLFRCCNRWRRRKHLPPLALSATRLELWSVIQPNLWLPGVALLSTLLVVLESIALLERARPVASATRGGSAAARHLLRVTIGDASLRAHAAPRVEGVPILLALAAPLQRGVHSEHLPVLARALLPRGHLRTTSLDGSRRCCAANHRIARARRIGIANLDQLRLALPPRDILFARLVVLANVRIRLRRWRRR